MSKTSIVIPEAEADLAEAYEWYRARRDGWGDRLILAVEATAFRAAGGNSSPE